jgi:hypothetical protein
MALSASNLASNIVTALLDLPVDPANLEGPKYYTVMAGTNPNQIDVLTQTFEALITELVDYIIANAVVTVSMATHTHSGVTTGPGISGPPVPGTVETGDPAAIPPIMPGGIT